MDEKYMEELGRIAKIFARRSKGIAYLTREDIEQECWVFGLKAYKGWNKEKGEPGPYIRRHLENKLRNLHRDLVTRNEPPCRACRAERFEECPKSEGNDGCRSHQRWAKVNSAKAHLSRPGGVEGPEKHYTHDDTLDKEELQALINEKIPPSLRSDYLRMVEGVKIPYERQRKIKVYLEGLDGEG